MYWLHQNGELDPFLVAFVVELYKLNWCHDLLLSLGSLMRSWIAQMILILLPVVSSMLWVILSFRLLLRSCSSWWNYILIVLYCISIILTWFLILTVTVMFDDCHGSNQEFSCWHVLYSALSKAHLSLSVKCTGLLFSVFRNRVSSFIYHT